MEIRILEMAQVDYPAHTFPWHVHPDHHTLSLVTGGMALLEFPKASIQTQPGHLIYIPAGFAHRTVVPTSFSYQVIRFQLPADYTTPIADYSITRAENKASLFQRWFLEQQEAKTTFGNVPALVWNHFTMNFSKEPAVDQAIERCLAFIHTHFDQPLSLEDLSKAALRSKSHLVRTFKQQLGVSPLRYLLGLKLDRAKELMQNNQSLSEVALATGFYDQSHFNRYFKRFMGLNPTQYLALVE
ncbi:MAG: AraC family transcriptional regulator [Bacteroidota bacterium]